MTRIIHISDTHFGTEVPSVVAAIKESIAALAPDAIILSGDITQRARPDQFQAASDFLNALPEKAVRLVVPGNHDIPLYNGFLRLVSPYGNYAKRFGKRESIWCDDEVCIVCYDATSPFRHTRGKLSRGQVLRPLGSLSGPPRILIACAHQPLVTAWPEDAHETLIGREQTAKLWSENKVDIALSGHVHVPLATTTHAGFPNLPRHFILAGAGTAVSHRIRSGAPNSFNVIATETLAEKKSIEITPYNYSPEAVKFTAGTAVKYTETPQGWR